MLSVPLEVDWRMRPDARRAPPRPRIRLVSACIFRAICCSSVTDAGSADGTTKFPNVSINGSVTRPMRTPVLGSSEGGLGSAAT